MLKNPGDFILSLMNARTVAHILHLQTGSYSQHMALGAFYEGIVPLIDSFAEVHQGRYGPIKFNAASFKLERVPIDLMNNVAAMLDAARAECKLPALQNIIDEMIALADSTRYKLKNLA